MPSTFNRRRHTSNPFQSPQTSFIPTTPILSNSHHLQSHTNYCPLISPSKPVTRTKPPTACLPKDLTQSNPSTPSQPPSFQSNPTSTSLDPLPPLPSSSTTALNISIVLSILSYLLPLLFSFLDAIKSNQPDIITTTFHLLTTKYESHILISVYATLFAVLHSGLASLRPKLTPFLGERLYRIVFALTSLPSAGALLAYFIAHRYDGIQLWTLQGYPWIHTTIGITSAISFLFLYPATLNIPEVAAVRKPSLKIFQTGIMRITRHPQLTGQVLWCVAHAVWIGTSFFLVASTAVVAHHCFAVWNGDRRLRDKFGQDWVEFEKNTSVLPFRAVLQGKQEIKLQEFWNTGYLGVAVFIMLAYWSHPAVLRLVGDLHL